MTILPMQSTDSMQYVSNFQYSCLENPMDGGAWKAAAHGVAEGQTRLSDFTFTFHFHALEKEMATHSSVLAWRIPGKGEPSGLLSMGSHRVRHDWGDLTAAAATCSILFPLATISVWISSHPNVKVWRASVHGVTKSRTWLSDWTEIKRQPWNQKAFVSWKKSYDKPRVGTKKQRHHCADQTLYSNAIIFPVVTSRYDS